jgi:hypothetical protein
VRAWPWLAALIVLLPFLARLATLAVWLASSPPPIYVQGDDAVLELDVLHAAHGQQLLGPYSRFHWSHPGPLYFYMQVLPYQAVGRHGMALYLGALAVNTAAAAGILAAGWRFGGRLALAWLGLFVAVHAALFDPLLGHPLNPFVTILPYALVLVLSAAVALGSGAALAAAVLVGSFAVQTHVGYAPSVAAALSLGVGLGLRRGLRWRVGGSAVLLGLAAWAAPLWEELTRRPGNLSVIVAFFATPHTPQPWSEVIRWFVLELAADPLLGRGAAADGAAALAIVVSLGAAVAVARRRGRCFAGSLALVCLLGCLVAFWSVRQIVDPVQPYLVLWVAALGGLSCAAVGLALAPARRAVLAACLLGAAVAGALDLRDLARDGLPRVTPVSDEVAAAAATLEPRLAPDSRPIVRIAAPDDWALAAGLVLYLAKQGRDVAVDPAWVWTFGEQHAPRGGEAPEIVVRDGLAVP